MQMQDKHGVRSSVSYYAWEVY